MNEQQYPSSAASWFASAARQVSAEESKGLWAWCPVTGERAYMTFSRDAGIFEVYSCPCGGEHQYAVR